MSSMNSLMVAVGISGVSNVTNQIEQIAAKINGVDQAAMKAARGGLAMMATAAVTAAAGVRNAMGDQVALTRLHALSDSLEVARRQMELIDRTAGKGVFGKDEIIEAALALEKSLGGSFEKNIELVEKLGARMGSIRQASEVIARLQRGQTFGVAMQLGEAGIGPDKLRAAGLDVQGRTIKNSPEEIMAAIARIMKADKTNAMLQGTLQSRLARLNYQIGEVIQTVGEPLLVPLSAVALVASKLAEGFRWLNGKLFGALGLIMAATLFWRGLTRTLPALAGFFRGLTGATGALNALAVAAGRAAGAQGVAGAAGVSAGAAAAGGAAAGAAATGLRARIAAAAAAAWMRIQFAAMNAVATISDAMAWIGRVMTGAAMALVAKIGAVIAGITAIFAGTIYLIERLANLIRPGSVTPDTSFFGPAGTGKIADWAMGRGKGTPQTSTPAGRPIRRDDMERLTELLYASSFN